MKGLNLLLISIVLLSCNKEKIKKKDGNVLSITCTQAVGYIYISGSNGGTEIKDGETKVFRNLPKSLKLEVHLKSYSPYSPAFKVNVTKYIDSKKKETNEYVSLWTQKNGTTFILYQSVDIDF